MYIIKAGNMYFCGYRNFGRRNMPIWLPYKTYAKKFASRRGPRGAESSMAGLIGRHPEGALEIIEYNPLKKSSI